MAGAAGTNIDFDGYIFDPTLDKVKQHYKESGMNNYLRGRLREIVGGYRTVKIPTASVLTLNSVPIQIVPAPASNQIIIPTLMVATMVYNSATYATNASGASLKYGTAGAGGTPGLALTQSFLQAGSGTNTAIVNPSATQYLPATTDFGVPLTLIAASSDPTTGDSDLYVRVWFQVVTVPFASPAVY